MQKREFIDQATVSDQELKNDDVIYMVFAKENGPGWEDILVENFYPTAAVAES